MKIVTDKSEIARVPTYIENFDKNIEGGIPEGFVTLVAGTSGTMKSSLVFNVLYNEVVQKKKAGVYITLEQSSISLLNHMISLGFDLSRVKIITISDIARIDENIDKIKRSVEQGTLVFTDVGAVRKELKELKNMNPDADWLNVLKNILEKLKQADVCDLFVLDSMAALYSLSEFKHPRTKLFYMYEYLRDLDITSFLISEMPLDESKYGEYDVEDFLADAILHLAMRREGLKVKRELNVVKLRATDANMDIFVLDFDRGRFRALTKLVG
ncbi:AAA family ATPase [Candidatus Woesearchaeota archaeon]|nr:AAA family ATPase [Candidatus Woesearchaeota archaeon]MBW3022433.1 AAA family ATPase [Candidatus Woesearchaeota archaeon]